MYRTVRQYVTVPVRYKTVPYGILLIRTVRYRTVPYDTVPVRYGTVWDDFRALGD